MPGLLTLVKLKLTCMKSLLFHSPFSPDYYWDPHRGSGDWGDWTEDAQILPFWKYGQPHKSYRDDWRKGKNKCLRIYLPVRRRQSKCINRTPFRHKAFQIVLQRQWNLLQRIFNCWWNSLNLLLMPLNYLHK